MGNCCLKVRQIESVEIARRRSEPPPNLRAATSGEPGNHVRIESVINGETYNVDYGHMSRSFVKKGSWVNAGNLIGLIGMEKIPSGFPPHVHIAVWRSVVIQGTTYTGYVEPSWISSPTCNPPSRIFDRSSLWWFW